jgi:DNA polymerase-1
MEAGLLVGHNIAFDLSFIMRDGIYIDNPKSRLWDTMIAEQILNYTKTDIGDLDKYSLQHLANKVGIQLDKTLQKSDWSGLLSEEQIKYAAMDAYATYEIHKNQKQKLDNGLRRVFAIEMGALPAITMLRTFGIGVDKEKLNKTYEELLEKNRKVLEELNEIYTEELIKAGINDLSLFKGINWRSAEQVKAALIRLGFNEEDIKDTKKDTLLRYRDNPVVAKLLELRGYEKKITHADQCMKAFKSDGRLYANWKQIGADTGRMSCAKPNPQQLPSSLRGCVVPKEGHVLIKADFSQIELRIAAAIANDQKMLKAFEEGTDLHKLTASLIKNKKADEVTKEERQLAKALNFGLIYGMREERLRNNAYAGYGVDITIDEAREYRKRFFETYVGLAKWHQKVETELRKHKSLVVTTLGGRKRLVNEVTEALNTPVQGTGADGLKAAAALYYKRLHEHGLIDKVRIVLMVHDEIVVEAPESLALKAAHLLTEAMVEGMQAIVKGVPIEVEAGIYADWGKTTHKIQEAWEVFCKLPKDSVVRDAILNDYEPDPRQAREDMSRYFHIKTILSGDDLIPF